MIKYIMYKVQD